MRNLLITLLLAGAITASAQESALLTGRVIGTPVSVDYAAGGVASTTVNTPAEAFDGDLYTCFASYDRSFTWVGLELDTQYVITRVGIAPRNDGLGPGRLVLGVFQGANREDFSDALPIFMITENEAKIGEMRYYDVDCSRGFRYVRYVGPHDARCNVAELVFEGYPSAGDDSHLYSPTNLPLIVVNTPGMEWFRQEEKKYPMEGSTVTIIDTDGTINLSTTAQIRGRGNASWSFPKKPFRIKFDKKQQPLDFTAKAKKWVMLSNYGDKTLMRNMLAFDASRRLGMAFTPEIRPVDVIFNGEYQGCYQMCDQIEVNKNRVNLTEMKATDNEGEALTGGYLIEVDAYAYDEDPGTWFNTEHRYGIPVTIHEPDPPTTEQFDYIRARFSALENALYASDYADPVTGYRSMLDLDSWLRHFIVGEVSGNTDTYWSQYYWLERGDPLFHAGPVWDFDLAFDNDSRTYPVNNKNDFICFNGSMANGMYYFVERIVRMDKDARQRLSEIYSHARKYLGYDSDTYLALIDQYAGEMALSQQLNFMRWKILNTPVHQNPRAYGSYNAECDAVRNYIRGRFDKLDKLIGIVDVPEDLFGDGTGGVAAPAAATAPAARPVDGGILAAEGASLDVYTPQGVQVLSGATGFTALPAGLYIATAPGAEPVKVWVK